MTDSKTARRRAAPFVLLICLVGAAGFVLVAYRRTTVVPGNTHQGIMGAGGFSDDVPLSLTRSAPAQGPFDLEPGQAFCDPHVPNGECRVNIDIPATSASNPVIARAFGATDNTAAQYFESLRALNKDLRATIRCLDDSGQPLGPASILTVQRDLPPPGRAGSFTPVIHVDFPLTYPPRTHYVVVSIYEIAHPSVRADWTLACPFHTAEQPVSSAPTGDTMSFGNLTVTAEAAEVPDIDPALNPRPGDLFRQQIAGLFPSHDGLPMIDCFVRIRGQNGAGAAGAPMWNLASASVKPQYEIDEPHPDTTLAIPMPPVYAPGRPRTPYDPFSRWVVVGNEAYPGQQRIGFEADLTRMDPVTDGVKFTDAYLTYDPRTRSCAIVWKKPQTQVSKDGTSIIVLNPRRPLSSVSGKPNEFVSGDLVLAQKFGPDRKAQSPFPSAIIPSQSPLYDKAACAANVTGQSGGFAGFGEMPAALHAKSQLTPPSSTKRPQLYIQLASPSAGWADVCLPGMNEPADMPSRYYRSQMKSVADQGYRLLQYQILVSNPEALTEPVPIKLLTIQYESDQVVEKHHIAFTLSVQRQFDPAWFNQMAR